MRTQDKPLSKRKQKRETLRWAQLNADVVGIMRDRVNEGLGFNCTFVDDDMNVLVRLAQRAVLAGLVTDAQPDMQRRFSDAAEKRREAHEKALGRAIQKQST